MFSFEKWDMDYEFLSPEQQQEEAVNIRNGLRLFNSPHSPIYSPKPRKRFSFPTLPHLFFSHIPGSGCGQEEAVNIRNGLNFARKVMTTDGCDLLILDRYEINFQSQNHVPVN